MARSRSAAALVSALLAVSPLLTGGTTPLAAPAGVAALVPHPGQVAVAARAPHRPCPEPSPAVPRPSHPARPTPDATQGAVGGPALATAGLATAPGTPTPPPVTATSWVVADLNTGAVLGACGPHEYGVPASVQKLLLAAAFMPDLKPEQKVRVTAGDLDFEPGSSAMGLVLDGEYTVETLWLGLLLNSGNDAANTLARLGGGPDGLAGGLREMNAEARRLGAYQTHAATPSGLDGPGQYTSAYDLALIARACFAREDFRRYASTREAQVPAQPPAHARGFAMFNDNQLLFKYPGALGGKTGYTDLARHSFVGAAERDGRRLLVTLLGAENQPQAGWQQGAALLDWGFGLRPDTAVGRLVDRTPDRSTASPAAAAPSAVARAAAEGAAEVRPAGGTGERSPLLLAALAGGGLAALVLLFALVRRRRARRGM
ncbi:D-alanyl-D-alanine carboxypeptidase [Micromonospora sp. NPDC049559]|uniref:D-alanyl-D-alanine carboxypeptidase family protein n=1 Tax=Micromonospora sp. NPDC049559 TaxID=3155923 RepID=UPI003447105C